MNTDAPTSGTTVKNHISFKNAIVVLGLSLSSSSSLLSSTSTTPSRQEIDHPKSSSTSSTSPPMTSSTVSSERVDRQVRGDPHFSRLLYYCTWNTIPIFGTFKISCQMTKLHLKRRRFGEPFTWPFIPLTSLVEEHLIFAKDQSRIHQFGKESLTSITSWIRSVRGDNLEG